MAGRVSPCGNHENVIGYYYMKQLLLILFSLLVQFSFSQEFGKTKPLIDLITSNDTLMKLNGIVRIDEYYEASEDSIILNAKYLFNNEGRLIFSEIIPDEDSLICFTKFVYSDNLKVQEIEVEQKSNNKFDTLITVISYKNGNIHSKKYSRGDKLLTNFVYLYNNLLLEINLYKGNQYGPYTDNIIFYDSLKNPTKSIGRYYNTYIWNYDDSNKVVKIATVFNDSTLIFQREIYSYENDLLKSIERYFSSDGNPEKLQFSEGYKFLYNDLNLIEKVLAIRSWYQNKHEYKLEYFYKYHAK